VNRTDAEQFLTKLFQSTPNATAHFPKALDGARLADANGRAPSSPDYVETIDPWWAAALVADHLAIAGAMSGVGGSPVVEFSSEGSTFKMGRGTSWFDLARLFRSRSTLGDTLGVIEIDYTPTFVPRSSADLDSPMWWRDVNGWTW